MHCSFADQQFNAVRPVAATDRIRAVKLLSLFASVVLPAETQPQPASSPKRRPRFWVGPLVAGGCFAFGFGLTQRIVALQGGESPSQAEAFAPQQFPGEPLERLRARWGGDSKPLRADVAAREAELAKTRPPKPKAVDKAKAEAERLASEARRSQQQALARRTAVEPQRIPAPVLPPAPASQAEPTGVVPEAKAPKPQPKPMVSAPRPVQAAVDPVVAPAATAPLLTRPGISFPTQSPAFQAPAPPPTP